MKATLLPCKGEQLTQASASHTKSIQIVALRLKLERGCKVNNRREGLKSQQQKNCINRATKFSLPVIIFVAHAFKLINTLWFSGHSCGRRVQCMFGRQE